MQRVSRATVRVAGEAVGDMGPGLLALVGVAEGDGPEQAVALARKLVHLRVFEDADGRMNHSLLDHGGTLGVVSQFTLLADTSKGRRPFFGAAADPALAEPIVEAVVGAAQR
ncbi:MAG: D-aminoacyl-tRNA deacylase, partial [Myxococcota bacterium]